MASKTRYNKSQFEETSPKYQLPSKNAGRDKLLQLVMPKLNNFNSGQENMRNLTHLKLDPIDQSFQGNVQQFINQQIDPSQVANRAGPAASTQF